MKEAGAGAADVAALEKLTRALVGITLQSREVLGEEVTLPQFRLLLAASALGRVPSSRLAEAATLPASSATRLADRLEAAGLLVRGADPRSRSIVTIEVTAAGRDLVKRVVVRRHELLAAVLERMPPGERAAVTRSALRFTELSGNAGEPGARPHPAWLMLFAPVAGGLVVGLMARYGSEKIRGHGMPETIDVILTGSSRVAPRVAVLKPVSAAISIGTGGPFGAEGPIIMTGGAVGSILAPFLHLTADERKTLLVAGAAGGMAATRCHSARERPAGCSRPSS